MAAAPVIPEPDYVQDQTIVIDSTLTPTPQGCIISAPVGQQMSVTFTNNSGATIAITFVPQGVFTDIPSLANNSSSQPQTLAGGTNAGVNYYINGDTANPWAIQVETGPMIVQIGGTSVLPTYTPNPVAIPLGATTLGPGRLEITGGNSITWVGGNDPFSPPIKTADGQSHPLSGSANTGTYTYNAGPSPNNAPGPGKVIVRSSS